MSLENRPKILLIGNPQTSKNASLQGIDLLQVPAFKSVPDEFERVLGMAPQASLHPDRQIASVVMSIGAHRAFVTGLEERVQPGLIEPSRRKFDLVYSGHSVGEMADFVEAGICTIPTMAWMLNERERITQNPIGSGLRQMVAVVGIDADRFEASIDGLRGQLADKVDLFLANVNTNDQVVVGMSVLEGELKAARESLGGFIAELRDPITGQQLFPGARLHPLRLPNAFHTAIMALEERMYIGTIGSRLTGENFQTPREGTVYSPTLPGWVETREDVYDVVQHILTKPVKFSRAMRELRRVPNLRAIVTADVLGTTPDMVRKNIGTDIPILNIKDKETLDQAVSTAAELVS